MNISAIIPFFEAKNNVFNNQKHKTNHTNFGLKMNNTLSQDTVSFKGAALTPKGMGDAADMINNKLALRIREEIKPAHNALTKLMKEAFADMIENGLLTIKDRIKKPYSICEKTTTTQLFNKKAIMQEMKDISGLLFVLEDKKSFNGVVTRLIKLMKSGKIVPDDLEYYRLTPIRKGKKKETFDSLDIERVERLGDVADEVSGKPSSIFATKPSKSGYSGLHLTVKNPDGTYSEIQIMTRAMHNLKEVENFFYKVKNGKDVDPKYSYIEDILAPLKPLKNEEYLPEEEKKAHKAIQDAIKEYTLEAYKERLQRPYVNRNEFVIPNNPIIAKYDFNKIGRLKDLIDKGEI